MGISRLFFTVCIIIVMAPDIMQTPSAPAWMAKGALSGVMPPMAYTGMVAA